MIGIFDGVVFEVFSAPEPPLVLRETPTIAVWTLDEMVEAEALLDAPTKPVVPGDYIRECVDKVLAYVKGGHAP